MGRVTPLSQPAQFAGHELSADVGKRVPLRRRGGRDHAVELVDAGVERPMVGA